MFTLPKVSFSFNDFEPVLDAKTMEIHLTKHHQAYVDNLNKLLETELGKQIVVNTGVSEVENLISILQKANDAPEEIRQALKNQAGGHFNHSMWWDSIQKPSEQNMPTELVLAKINSTFGTFETFKEKFSSAAMSRFGSGWAWLVKNEQGELEIESTPNQDNPLSSGKYPLLGLDVWEHAYYLQYQNRRAEYVTNFWKIVNWKVVEGYYNYFSKK